MGTTAGTNWRRDESVDFAHEIYNRVLKQRGRGSHHRLSIAFPTAQRHTPLYRNHVAAPASKHKLTYQEESATVIDAHFACEA